MAEPSTIYKLSILYGVDLETLLSAGGVIEKKEQSTPKHKILQSVAASAGTALTDEEEKELKTTASSTIFSRTERRRFAIFLIN